MECCCRLPQTTVVNNWVDMHYKNCGLLWPLCSAAADSCSSPGFADGPDDGATTEPDDGAATEPDDGATTEPATDDYESIEAVANADDQAIPFIPREKRSADVRLIFRREKERKHPDTGKIQDGHWCKVCLFH
ncbi:hypothetical protein EDB89DRAFT_1902405 [Lactarius sanguifluus]|nr:hypothetical protein EDB89DRAFT_1902405 [Lactarius sanguifluus]